VKIVVCVKQVPDSAARLTVRDGKPDWGEAPLVINPWDEFAVEAALLLQEARAGEVTALSIGDEQAREALKHALAMGCSQAVHVSDPALSQPDSLSMARVLSAAVRKIGGVDLAIFGRQAIDTDMGTTPVQTARCLGWAALTLVSRIQTFDLEHQRIEVERSNEEGREVVSGRLPAVLSVTKDIAEPRYPSFIGIRKASRAEIPRWSLADLGMELPVNRIAWHEVVEPPQRTVSTEIIRGKDAAETAKILVDKIMSEGVV